MSAEHPDVLPNEKDLDEYRQALNQAISENQDMFDRTILSLASGALVVSITFLRDLAPRPSEVGLIMTSWILLGAALLATTSSFFVAEKGLAHSTDLLLRGELDHSRGGSWGTATTVINRLAGATFVLGIGFLIAFAIVNLPEGR